MPFPSLRSPARAVATSLVVLAAAAPLLGAQAPDSTVRAADRRPRGASPFLAADHWAVAAARRLYAAGLVGREFGAGERTPTVRDVALAIGRLGGHMNRASDGMPGWITLWRGMRELQLLVEGVRLARILDGGG